MNYSVKHNKNNILLNINYFYTKYIKNEKQNKI